MCLSCSLEQLPCCPHLNNSPSLLPFCCFSPQAFACTVRNSGINGEARSWRPLAPAVRFGPSKLGTTNRDSAEISRTFGASATTNLANGAAVWMLQERGRTRTHTHTVTACLLIRSSNGQEKVSANGLKFRHGRRASLCSLRGGPEASSEKRTVPALGMLASRSLRFELRAILAKPCRQPTSCSR